ncbi:MAG: hypothetical protein F7C35_08205 [Desulfurococcales archaeon]|nr:hypothetical protein [Desulfurococcales archaeon]
MRGGGKTTSLGDCTPVKCRYCGYTWCTRAEGNYVTCPRCQRKTPKVPFLNEINRLFSKLEEYSSSQESKTVLNLIRVLLLAYIRKGELSITVLQALYNYTNHNGKSIPVTGKIRDQH